MKRSRAQSNSSLALIASIGLGGGLVGMLLSMVVLSSQGQTTSWKMALFGLSSASGAAIGVTGYCMLKQQQQRLSTRLAALEARTTVPLERTVKSQSEASQDRASATDLAMIKPVDYGTAVGATQTLLVADAMGRLHQRRLEAGYPPLDVAALLQPMTVQQADAAECFEQDREALVNAAVQQSIPEPARSVGAANGTAFPSSASISSADEEEMVRQAVMQSETGLEDRPFFTNPLEGDRGSSDSSDAASYSGDRAVELDHDLSGNAWGNSSGISSNPLGFY
jgi:hypothetical protein